MTGQSRAEILTWCQATWRLLRLPPVAALAILTLGTLSCSWARPVPGPATIVTRTAWPTFTPAPGAAPSGEAGDAPTAEALAGSSATAANTPTPPPVETSPAEAQTGPLAPSPGQESAPQPSTVVAVPVGTVTSQTSGWSFAGVQAYTGPYGDSLLVHGDILNNTDIAQQLEHISGTLYDSGGQPIAAEDRMLDLWPIDVVLPGERVPFGLIVEGVQSSARLDLRVEAEPSSQTRRQDFEFTDLKQWTNQAGEYCVGGRIRNPGERLDHHLAILAVLYDTQDKIVNFGDEVEPLPNIVGDQTLIFEICVQTLNQDVARYDLRAWGE